MITFARAERRWPAVACAFLGAMVVAVPGARAASTETDIDARIPQVFAELVQEGEPGCSVGVMQDGALIHASAYGLADLAGQTPLDAGSVFNIASVSKQFTAFSILLLDQRKALSIDDPLVKYVPELSASAPDVTLRHLVHHTGGLRDYMDLLMLRGRRTSDGATQFETVQTLGRQRGANFPPGAEYSYSNSGYVLLATVVERVSGRSMKQFAEENIFGPLGMADTTIVDRYPAGLSKLARAYAKNGDGFDIDESAWEQVGDGQVHTTVVDLFRWAENFHTGRVGGPGLMKRMVETGSLASGERLTYAAGLQIGEQNGLATIRHSGGWGGYRAHFLLFPQHRFAVNVFCNRGDGRADRFASSIADLYLAPHMQESDTALVDEGKGKRQEETPASQWKPENLANYAGVYWSEEAEARCVLVQRNEKLILEGCAEGVSLQPTAEGEFHASDIDVRLRFGTRTGEANRFSLRSYGICGLAFTRR